MVEGEAAGTSPPQGRTGEIVFVLAVILTVAAWLVLDLYDRHVGPLGDAALPLAWLVLGLVLVCLARLVARARSSARKSRSLVAAAGGHVVGLFLVAVLAFVTYEGCGLSPDSASWNDKGLHRGLPEGGDHDGNPVTTEAPPLGFAFRDADLDSRWTGYSLINVAWGRGIDYDFGPTALVAEPGMVRAAYLDLGDLRGHRAEVVEFLQGFGATTEDAARIAQAMEANATSDAEAAQRWGYSNFVEYHAAIPTDWTPKVAWDSFCCIGQQPADDASQASDMGFADLRVGHWSFGFALETKRMEGDGFLLYTDAEGRVSFDGLSTGREDVDEYKGKVKRALKALALPEPERDAMSVGGSIC